MKKTIAILTLGSRGDIQPYIALGLGLEQAGYTVRLAAPHTFTTMIQAYGLDVFPMRINPQEELNKPEAQALFKEGIILFNVPKIIRFAADLYRQTFEDFWQATEGADAIINTSVSYGALECGEVRGIPVISCHLAPLSPTREFSSYYTASGRNLGPLNRMTHSLMEHASWQSVRGALNAWRKTTLGLPPVPLFNTVYARTRAASTPILYGYSPSVVPKPSDWSPKEIVTGYWFLDAAPDYTPPQALVEFLQAGPPPVYIGFGSMSDSRAEDLSRKVIDAVRKAQVRAVMASGWGGLGQGHQSSDIFVLESVPHDWLFPRVSAIVHHGGAGTTGASLRAGKPTLITPFLLDQYGWAEVVARHGVGPKLKPIHKISADELAQALQTATSDSVMRQQAAKLGKKIQAEDGVARAVEAIDTALHTRV